MTPHFVWLEWEKNGHLFRVNLDRIVWMVRNKTKDYWDATLSDGSDLGIPCDVIDKLDNRR